MAKYCSKYGTKIEENTSVCPVCGAPVSNTKVDSIEFKKTDEIKEKIISNSRSEHKISKKIFRWIGTILFVIFIVKGIFSVYAYLQEDSSTSSSTEITSVNKNESGTLKEANDILINKDAGYTLSAVSNIDDDGFIGLSNDDKTMSFIIYDKKDDVIAVMAYKKELLNLKGNKTGTSYNPVILTLYIKKDKASQDSKLGYWDDDTHIFSVYALYDIDSNGNVVPGMLISAEGKNSAHYQDYLQEQQNVNIINLALTHADSLAKDINDRGVSIP